MSTPVDRLKELIKELKTTPEEFSKKIKIDITPVLNKKQQLTFTTLKAIASAYKNVNPDWITFGTGDPIKKRPRISYKSIEEKQIKQIAARLKETRKNSGWTIEDFASECNISSSGYFAMESGKTMITVNKLKTFCDILKVSYSYIIDGTEDKTDRYKSLIAAKDEEIKTLKKKAELYDQIMSLTKDKKEK